MKKIKFKTEGMVSVTPCPFLPEHFVGGASCSVYCNYFGGETNKDNEILCSYVEK
jgi:hypothetical protein